MDEIKPSKGPVPTTGPQPVLERETSDIDPSRTEVDKILERVADSDMSVLITGETGVGKERLAELLFRFSRRAAAPFVRIACGAFPDSLIESEMFGYESGAFTDADRAKPGLLETAQGGTVFLDEVGELSGTAQVKLLRLVEERRVLRIGALTPTRLDVRFISATHRNLTEEVARGTFRQDLYYRLNGVTLLIPPLRERTHEIGSLARTFIARASVRNGWKNVPELTREALQALEQHAWPGNVRELKNVIERAVLLSGGDRIAKEHLPLENRPTACTPQTVADATRRDSNAVQSPAGSMENSFDVLTGDLPANPTWAQKEIEAHDVGHGESSEAQPRHSFGAGRQSSSPGVSRDRIRDEILSALAAAGGNQTQAAEALGISRRTLINRLEAFGIPRPRKRTSSGET